MKVFFIAGLFVIFSVSTVFAQKELTFSAHVGTNYSNFVDSDFFGFDYKYGVSYTVGAGLEIGLNEPWSLVTGLLYDRKVVNLEYTIFIQSEMGNEVVDFSDSFTFNYLVVPAMGRYTFENEKTPLFINAGLYTGYLAKTTLSFDGTTSGYNSIDGGIALGAGMHIPLSEEINLILEIRDYFGLTDINSGPNTDNLNSVQLLLGISF
jgi:opacity protein-like surface antigen|tara:strand:+ start:24538 stop:25158 length:621 start_codon:yes stop_codon:yes gene_type:complete